MSDAPTSGRLGALRTIASLLLAVGSSPVWYLVPASPCIAQVTGSPTARSSKLSPPQARPFQGQIDLQVDATDTRHGIIKAHETIPVQTSGDLLLLYSEWETASHAPTVPVASLTGLLIAVDGHRIEWRRDPLDVHVFHVPVPMGARQVTMDLQYIADRGSMREGMLSVPWQRVLLYPAGWAARAIPVAVSLRVPDGLTVITSLDQELPGKNGLRFAPTSLDKLVDAPAYAARHVRVVDLASGDPQPIRLDILSDDPALLAIGDAEISKMRALAVQTRRLLGPAPYRHYDAIVTLDDGNGAGGIEHLEEGENVLPSHYFIDPARQLGNRDLIAHELVHAWNGRFRQPADLWTPTYNQPVAGSLLWVYEGQTEFWGRILAARAGLRSRQETLDKLALDAAIVANRPGRVWKSLADSTNDAIYMAGHHVGWRDWQRREDYYPEGVLLWLDVDARLRELSGGTRGLDDFAGHFFHVDRPDSPVSTYTFDDVCHTLDALAHEDWSGFLQKHLLTHDDADAMAGLARAGWRLAYATEPTETFRQYESENGGLDLTYSIGAVVDDDGRVTSVAWNGPAFVAGLAPGMRISAVANEPFSAAALRTAVAKTPETQLIITVGSGPSRQQLEITYRGGLRYPTLQRIDGTTDRLSALLAPRGQ